MIKLFTTVLYLLLVSAAPANAGPMFAAVLAVGGSFGAAFGATALGTFMTTTMVGRLLTSVALGALQNVLTPKSKSGQSSGIQTNVTQTGADKPVSWVMGRYATAGVMACPPMTHGKVGKTPNAYLTYVVNLSDIPGMSLHRVAINGVWVDVLTTYNEYGFNLGGEHTGWGWVKYYNGTQTAADPMLLDKYGAYPERPWAADMIGRDCCYAIVTFRFNQELYSGFPTVLFDVSGIPLYDPRKDSSVGGSGTQRWDNRTTWAPSNTPVVQIYNVLRGIQITSAETWGGSVDVADVPLSTWMTAMNLNDTPVNVVTGWVGHVLGTIGGVETMHQSGIEVFSSDEPASIIEELLKACAGDICDIGGVWKVRAGNVSLPVYMFTDDDLIVTQAATFDPFPAGLSGVYNCASATYPDSISTYQTETSPLMVFDALVAEDQNQRLPTMLSLPAVTSRNQVQRLCDGYIRENRNFRRHSLPMPPAAMLLEPLDAVAWTSDRNGYSGKVFEVMEIRDDVLSGLQGVSIRERDPSDYSWSSDRELPFTPTEFMLVLPPAQSIPSWNVAGVNIVDAASTARRPALQFSWVGSEQDSVTGVEWEIRLNGTTTVALRGATTLVESGLYNQVEGILPNTVYQARARFVGGNTQNWSVWATATTPNTGFGNADFGPDGAYTTLFVDNGLYAIRDVVSLPAAGSFVGEKVFNRTDGKLYQWTGTVWQLTVAGAADGSVDAASFAAGVAPVEIFAALPTTGNYAGRTVFLTTNSKLYRYTGTAFTSVVPTTDLTGTISTGQIADDAVTIAKFASGITPVEIVATLPTVGNYAGRAVFLTTNSKLYRYTGTAFTVAVDGADITANTITAGQIAAGAIGATEIAAGAIVASKILVSDFANIYPDFDMLDTAFYTSTNGAGVSFAGTTATNLGQRFIVVAVDAALRSVNSGWFNIEPSTEYLIAGSAFIAASSTGTCTLTFETGSLGSTGIATGLTSDVVLTRTDSTSLATVAVNITTGATARRGRFVMTRAAGGTGTARSGGYKVQKKATGALIVDGAVTADKIAANTITAGQIAAGAIGATEIAAGAIVASKILVSDFANIYPDFDMLDTAFYTSANGAVVTFPATTSANLGLKYANIAVNAALRSVNSGWFNIEPSTEYRIGGATWLATATAGSGTCTLTFETGSLGSTGAVTVLNATVVSTKTDTTYSAAVHVAVNITTGATARRGRFVMTRAAGGTSAAFAGGYKVQKKATGALIVDGTITGDKIFANTITGGLLATTGIITTTAQIGNGLITSAKIGDAAITSAKIGDLEVSRLKLAVGSVTAHDLLQTTFAFSGNTTWGAWFPLGYFDTQVPFAVSDVPERYVLRPSLDGMQPQFLTSGTANFGLTLRLTLTRFYPGGSIVLATYDEILWQATGTANSPLFTPRNLNSVVQITNTSYNAGDTLRLSYDYKRETTTSGSTPDIRIALTGMSLSVSEFFK